MQEKLITTAQFDPAVKKYWMVLALIITFFTAIGIPLLPLVGILVMLLSQRILNAMSAELFERKLVVKRGVFVRIEKTIPLEKITDVGLTQGPLMRAFGIYRLDFETAGQSGAGALVSMLGIVDAAAFRERILAQKDRLQFDVRAAVDASGNPAGFEGDQLTALLTSVQNIERMLAERG